MSQHKGRRRILIAALLVIPALAAWPLWRRAHAVLRVSQEIGKLEKQGRPVRWKDLLQQPPHNQRNTAGWTKTLAKLEEATMTAEEDVNQHVPYVFGYAEDPQDGEWKRIDATENFLTKHRSLARQLHQLIFDDSTDLPIDYIWGIYLSIPKEWDVGRFLKLETHYYAYRDDAQKTAEMIRAELRFADKIGKHPSAISSLGQLMIYQNACEKMRHYAATLPMTDSQLEQLHLALRTPNFQQNLYDWIAGSRIDAIARYESGAEEMDVDEIKEVLLGEEVSEKSAFSEAWSDFLGWLTEPRFMLRTLEYYERLLDIVKLPWPEAFDEVGRLDSEFKDFRGTSFFVAYGTVMARQRAYDAVIAAELYRRKHKRHPDRLEELVPELLPKVPIDPYSGKPLRLVMRDGRFVVYSIGANRIDDGGNEGEYGLLDIVGFLETTADDE